MSKWHDVSVSFTVELGRNPVEGGGFLQWNDLTYEKELPDVVLSELEKLVPADCEDLELDFDVRSSGYYQPAVMYLRNGDPGWPQSGDDERECKGVDLLVPFVGEPAMKNYVKRVSLSKASADLLEGLYSEEIQSADLPESDYEGDRGDYEYDRMKDGD